MMMPFGEDGGIHETCTDDGLIPLTRTFAGASSGAARRKISAIGETHSF